MQPPRQHDSRLVITRILRPPPTPRPGGRRFPPPPPVPLRSTAARLAAHPQPQRSSAPRPAASCAARLYQTLFPLAASLASPHRIRRASHHASGPRKIPAATLQESASGASFVSSRSQARAATSGRYGVKCCPRHSRRFLHSYRRLCSLVIPAGSLDAASSSGKSSYRLFR
jgi:hypothetical protein